MSPPRWRDRRFAGRFSTTPGESNAPQEQRASRGKTHDLPVCRPASVHFGCCQSDIGTRLSTSARPPPRTHLAGSLFATYTGSASCFLQTAHCWTSPCLVGVPLPSDHGGFQGQCRPPCFGPCAMPGTRHSTSGKAGGLICEPLKAVLWNRSRAPSKGATTHPDLTGLTDGPLLPAP